MGKFTIKDHRLLVLICIFGGAMLGWGAISVGLPFIVGLAISAIPTSILAGFREVGPGE
jgi:hypothetical protein